MTATTQTVRDQGFLPMECDVPPGMTLAEYRARRARTARRRLVPRPRRRR